MGQVCIKRLIILSTLFLVASILVYFQPTSTAAKKSLPLQQAFNNIDSWKSIRHLSLDQAIIDELNLDDYTYQQFLNNNITISVYIGYYYTTKKVGAAHDPMFCFPGQGWQLSHVTNEKFLINSVTGESISISLMKAQKGEHIEFIVYWYQSYDRTSTSTFSQKIFSLSKKLLNNREDNAFVRITTSVDKMSLPETRNILESFIKSFYPLLINYVKEDSTDKKSNS